MALYALSGSREAALRQYRDCVRILETEIGVPPLDETTRLYEDIKLNSFKPPEKKTDSETRPSGNEDLIRRSYTQAVQQEDPFRLPLIGRESELVELRKIYTEVRLNGCCAAVVGEAGIGKTRLVEEFLAVAYKAHTYGEPGLGHMSDLENLSRRDAEVFFQKYYVASNVIGVVVGDAHARPAPAAIGSTRNTCSGRAAR